MVFCVFTFLFRAKNHPRHFCKSCRISILEFVQISFPTKRISCIICCFSRVISEIFYIFLEQTFRYFKNTIRTTTLISS